MKIQQWRLYDTLRVSAPRFSSTRQTTATRQARFTTQHHRPLGSFRPLDTLKDASISTFRETSFTPELPIVLPRQHFRHLPAFARWFQRTSDPDIARLDTDYLEQHGAATSVPLELTQKQGSSPNATSPSPEASESTFRQFYAPLSLFLDWIRTAENIPQSTRLYLAQCQLSDLPQTLREDFPTPDLVLQAGRGDVYDTNVWIGHPPTYTPLHRDPNPNLFVQLAGQKVVRLLSPNDGQALFTSVRRELGQSGGREAAAFRGEEMMQGRERLLLEQAVWGDEPGTADSAPQHKGFEAHLEAGDGLFIPKGWWHSIQGVGKGVTASVNWWFR